MSELSNPHDVFFRETMSRVEVVRDFLAHYLPPEVANLLNLDALEIRKNTFVDDDLREHFSDLVYQVQLRDGRPACVYILFEHKSHPEPMIALQLLRYMVRIWEQALKQHQPLCPILPLVVYHGTATWTVGARLHDVLDVPEAMAAFVPDYRYLLCDVSHMSDDQIKGEVNLRLQLMVLKYIFSAQLPERLPGLMSLAQELEQSRDGLDYLRLVLIYLSSGSDKLTRDELTRAVRSAWAQGESIMGTIAEQWVQEGRQQGMQQGMQTGIQQGILRGIESNLKFKFGVPGLQLMNEIRSIPDVGLLESIHDSILTAASVDSVRAIYS